MNPLLQRIAIDPRICRGKPFIKGTRIWVSLVLEFIAENTGLLGDSNIQELSEERFVGTLVYPVADPDASRERERLDRLTSQWGHSEHLIAHLVMCVTLQGGCSAEEALQLVTEERHAMGFPETVPALELVNQLAEALPGPSGVEVDAVRPDLIGEA